MFEPGTIVVATDPYGNTPRRPYLVVSDESHPFAGTQSIALAITTKSHSENLPLEGEFEVGRLNRPSFVSPWAVVSLMDVDVDRVVARLSREFIEEAAARTSNYVVGD